MGRNQNLFRDSLSVQVVDDLTIVNNIAEILTFYIVGEGFKHLKSSVYRSPSYSPREFNNLFLNEILSKFHRNTDVLISGHFNLNLFNPIKVRCISDFIDNFLSFSYFPIINIPTVFHENNPITKFSLIDHIWSNFKKGSCHLAGVIEYPITDHLPMFYIFSNNNILQNKS